MSEAVYGPVVMGSVTVLFGWLLLRGFRSGTMEWGYFGLKMSGDRRSQPGRFWTAASLLAISFFLCLAGTVAIMFWPHGIGS